MSWSNVRVFNEIFAWHLLATSKHQKGQILDGILQLHRKLTEVGNFAAVAAEQYRQKMIRDVYLHCMQSTKDC